MPFNFNRHLIFLITSEVEHLFIGWLYFIFSAPQPPFNILLFFYFNLLDTIPSQVLCACVCYGLFSSSPESYVTGVWNNTLPQIGSAPEA